MSKLLKHFSKSIKKENKQFHILNSVLVSVLSWRVTYHLLSFVQLLTDLYQIYTANKW